MPVGTCMHASWGTNQTLILITELRPGDIWQLPRKSGGMEDGEGV